MARNSESRFLVTLAVIGVLFLAVYGVDRVLRTHGRGPLLGGGLSRLVDSGCSALPFHVPVPCWLVVVGPLVLFFVIMAMAGGRR